MSRSQNQKAKLLYLQRILLEKTDEEHPMTIAALREELARCGIPVERKTLYSDLELLQGFGLDVCTIRSKTVGYYVGSRDFQPAELKLLVDAIQSSKFITRKKSLELISKLERLVSVYEGKQLQRQVFVTNRVKTLNERIYYNVDILHNAISADRRIRFRYMRWAVDFSSPERIRREPRRGGEPYTVSPWALCWDDENYYLIAFDSEAGIIKHYRVDKMEGIETLNEPRDGGATFADFNLAHYAKSVFSMFGGEEESVTLSVDNEMIGVIVDRFGTDVIITKESNNTFCVTLRLILSPQFYAWVFGLDNRVRILSPQCAREEFLDKISSFYDAMLR